MALTFKCRNETSPSHLIDFHPTDVLEDAGRKYFGSGHRRLWFRIGCPLHNRQASVKGCDLPHPAQRRDDAR
jgi:hypothetical protein